MEDLSPMPDGRGSGLYSRSGIDVCGDFAARSLCVGETYGVRGESAFELSLAPRLHFCVLSFVRGDVLATLSVR